MATYDAAARKALSEGRDEQYQRVRLILLMRTQQVAHDIQERVRRLIGDAPERRQQSR
jgi:hypothetical protein